MTTLASPLSPPRAFRATPRVNARVLVGLGLAVLSVLALVVGLSVVLPDTQTVLQATRDLPAGTVIGVDDVTPVKVHVPENMARAAIASGDLEQLVGRRIAASVSAGEMFTRTHLASQSHAAAPGRVYVTIPIESYAASGGMIGPGDSVTVFASSRQSSSLQNAVILVDEATVVAVGRQDQASSIRSGNAASPGTASSNRAFWITLDLDRTQASAVTGAARSAFVDVGLVSPSEHATSR
jgi:Flp pilus assembly protein CpaB